MKRKAIEQIGTSPTRVKYNTYSISDEYIDGESLCVVYLDVNFGSDMLKRKLSAPAHKNITPDQKALIDSMFCQPYWYILSSDPQDFKISETLFQLEMSGFDIWLKRPLLTEMWFETEKKLNIESAPLLTQLVVMLKLWDYRPFVERKNMRSWQNIQMADEKWRNDKEIIMLAAKQESCSIVYASTELLNNKQFILDVVKKYAGTFKHLPVKFREDFDIISPAISKNSDYFQYIGGGFRKTRKNMLRLVSLNGGVLFQVNETTYPNIMKDREIVLTAVCNLPAVLLLIPVERNNRQLILDAVSVNGKALVYAPQYQKDKEIVLSAVKNWGLALEFVRNELRQDREIVLEAVKQNGLALFHASHSLRDDREIVIEAIKQNGDAIIFASHKLQNDTEICCMVDL